MTPASFPLCLLAVLAGSAATAKQSSAFLHHAGLSRPSSVLDRRQRSVSSSDFLSFSSPSSHSSLSAWRILSWFSRPAEKETNAGSVGVTETPSESDVKEEKVEVEKPKAPIRTIDLDLFPGSSKNKKKVLIIGAGMSGLVCAKVLKENAAKRGADIDFAVIEQSNHVGGRVWTDEVDGFLLDRGFQVFIEAYPSVQEHVNYEALDLQPFRPGAFVCLDSDSEENKKVFEMVSDPIRRPQDLVDTLFSRVGSLGDKVLIGLYRLGILLESDEALLSKREAALAPFLSYLGFGPDLTYKFFRPFFRGIFLADLDELSSRMFEFVFKKFAQGPASLPAKGMKTIPLSLAADVGEEKIYLDYRVRSISKGSEEGGKKYKLRLDSRNEKGEDVQADVEADAVVIATEGPAAERLIQKVRPEWERPKVSSASVCRSSTCVYYSLPKDEVPSEALGVSEEDPSANVLVLNGVNGRSGKVSLVNNVAFVSEVSPSYAPEGQALLSVTVVGIPQGSENDKALDAQIRLELGEWFGAEKVRNWNLLKIYRIPYAQPAQNPPNPAGGFLSQEQLGGGDGLYVAGDHAANPTLDGAVKSGERAADAVIEAFFREAMQKKLGTLGKSAAQYREENREEEPEQAFKGEVGKAVVQEEGSGNELLRTMSSSVEKFKKEQREEETAA
uniref:Amine oxidase n=1 Tax=Chromera velia CCMP2878 TaxID=1169474 RepID=A0A0G4GYB0_9ALVE|mmetsp:Transcript_43306/g.85453  ORF Transcript_43306/g.85453 Transcript_43306/m.85453 type:complete len:672 (-) Transcript_43306:1396-3411(-)|eukprot:Cvel_23892.t1-p1 / transcript=Cvel_23892.t1 / gene=Cvel_23892 / organism=Chromera_velia_CCMP2878 / gene_product=L-amino-acid oxidase, putative / transcript_product=L-amino-acid oxidase, putative / location=Cvel_scaffold2517:21933-26600(-) / protein_length=671 / sequence_SO=supercontig / SO=protein_coding / is_pseudo=false